MFVSGIPCDSMMASIRPQVLSQQGFAAVGVSEDESDTVWGPKVARTWWRTRLWSSRSRLRLPSDSCDLLVVLSVRRRTTLAPRELEEITFMASLIREGWASVGWSETQVYELVIKAAFLATVAPMRESETRPDRHLVENSAGSRTPPGARSL